CKYAHGALQSKLPVHLLRFTGSIDACDVIPVLSSASCVPMPLRWQMSLMRAKLADCCAGVSGSLLSVLLLTCSMLIVYSLGFPDQLGLLTTPFAQAPWRSSTVWTTVPSL